MPVEELLGLPSAPLAYSPSASNLIQHAIPRNTHATSTTSFTTLAADHNNYEGHVTTMLLPKGWNAAAGSDTEHALHSAMLPLM
mmetsp:Transcript_7614/g.16514  ORF Transcript_7614/g.16514 Transcript_7614/m.16514 type:complete len:84 (+) Transcript_7614:582-833(+)